MKLQYEIENKMIKFNLKDTTLLDIMFKVDDKIPFELMNFLSFFRSLNDAKRLRKEILAVDMDKGDFIDAHEEGIFSIGIKHNLLGTVEPEPLIPVPQFIKVLDIYIAELERKEKQVDKYVLESPIVGEFEI